MSSTATDDTTDLVSVDFTVNLTAARMSFWWLLFIATSAYGFVQRHAVTRAWIVYGFLYLVLLSTCLEDSIFLGYTSSVKAKNANDAVFQAYIFFSNLSLSSFLGVLLVVAAGFCITREDLGPHKPKVVTVPTIVFITGLVTDYIFFHLSRQDGSNTYDLSEMSTLEATIWFVCSVLNLSCLILSWIYIFDMVAYEGQLLEAQHRRQHPTASGTDPSIPANVLAGPSGYGQLAAPRNTDVEAAPSFEEETVADRVAFQLKQKLFSRFAFGVTAYLVGNMLSLILPVFFNFWVQNVIMIMQFIVNYLFMASLFWIFRPQAESPYLMVGLSPEDAEERGMGNLATELAMSDLDPDKLEPTPIPASARQTGGSSRQSSQPPRPPTNRPLGTASNGTSRSTPAPAPASYTTLAGAPPPGPPSPKLPVSTAANDVKPAGSTRSSSRAGPREPNPNFSLDDDEDEGVAYAPLKRPPKSNDKLH